MDNLTHTLCGLALARTGLDRRGALVTPVLAIAANFPDVDHVWSVGGLRYLLHHRGISHSFAGIVVEALVLALAAFGIGKRLELEDTRFRPLLLAAALGLLSHLGLDALNSYGVRPWLPFSDARSFGDMAFIGDPWLWLGFGAAAFLGGERDKGAGIGRVWPFVGGLSLAAALAFCSHSGPSLWVPALYGLGQLAVLVLGLWADAIGRQRLARFALLLVLGYLATLAGTSAGILEQGRAVVESELAPGVRASAVVNTSVSNAPGVPWSGTAIVETAGEIRFVQVDLITGEARLTRTLEKHLDDPALEALRGTAELEAWHVFARHPFAARTDHGTIVLGDARYDPEARKSWCNLEVPLPGFR